MAWRAGPKLDEAKNSKPKFAGVKPGANSKVSKEGCHVAVQPSFDRDPDGNNQGPHEQDPKRGASFHALPRRAVSVKALARPDNPLAPDPSPATRV